MHDMVFKKTQKFLNNNELGFNAVSLLLIFE